MIPLMLIEFNLNEKDSTIFITNCSNPSNMDKKIRNDIIEELEAILENLRDDKFEDNDGSYVYRPCLAEMN